MTHDFDRIALNAARRWRDWGNTILLVGILGELLIDAFWPDWPEMFPLLRGKAATGPLLRWWSNHFWKPRTIAILLVGLVAFGGLILERQEGNEADHVADDMFSQQTAHLSGLIRLVSGVREITRDDPTNKLRTFAGTTIFIRFFDRSNLDNSSPFLSLEEAKKQNRVWWEAREFAGSFGELGMPWVGWKCQILYKEPLIAGLTDNVTIFSASNGRRPPEGSPERKGWDAAHALVDFLQNDLNLWTTRYIPLDVFDECPGLARDGVCVDVGANRPDENVAAFLRHTREVEQQREFEKLRQYR